MEISQQNSLYSYLEQTKMSLFYKNKVQEGKTGPVWELVPVGGGRYKEGEYGGNIMYTCVKMAK
jgi:hypothetical protein